MHGEGDNSHLRQSRGAYPDPALPPRQSRQPKTASRGPFYSLLPSRLGRGSFLKWLRRTHAWLGLWGAALGLMFGVTGILQNHRAMMKIPTAKVKEDVAQLKPPEPAPPDAQTMALWLQAQLALEKPAIRVQVDKPRSVIWDNQAVQQPERWQVYFAAPQRRFSAEYWVGNGLVTVKRVEGNAFALLMSLHKAEGVNAAWILLTDSIAGSFITLALTGVLLWTRLHGRRLLAAGLGLGSMFMGIWFAWSAM